MVKNWQKVGMLLTTQCLIILGVVFANPVIQGFTIPSQLGSVKEVFEAENSHLGAPKTIIQIQDAHCNYEAQKNLAGIIDYLVKEKKLRLIMVEGGSGDVSLSYLRGYTDKKAREEVAEKYLRMGKISGEEYLNIVSDYDLELYGIEDQGLYDANLKAFLDLEAYRKDGLADLENISAVIKTLKPHIYNAKILRFEQTKTDYQNKNISLTDYLDFLQEAFLKSYPSLKHYPHIRAFLESSRLEKELDFKLAENERNIFIKALAKMLDENGVKELIARTQDFKNGKITAQDYYTYLKDSSNNKIDIAQDYSQLSNYILYINTGKDIDTAQLLKEIGEMEEKTLGTLFFSDEQRRLNQIDKQVNTLADFLKLDLTPEEYAGFARNKSEFSTSSWIAFLTDSCNDYGIAMQPAASSVIDDHLDQLEEFYRVGMERESAFLRNVAQKMNSTEDNIAVLITGGFHTQGVSRLLKDNGYSYAVVTPAISKKSGSDIYYSVLRGDTEDAEYIEEDED
ncbi:MAG: hypothetical protein PHH68_07210 [Candidatus Omnitrophica bacterium]|jgi:hypothetical protein|nr:hypothetical protein [Candidatus Omnitrophota bacterium]MDD5080085.1 hypothetical protein [Candidatus Omnitrophota bacterium]